MWFGSHRESDSNRKLESVSELVKVFFPLKTRLFSAHSAPSSVTVVILTPLSGTLQA